MLKNILLGLSVLSNLTTLVGLWIAYISAPATVQAHVGHVVLLVGAACSVVLYLLLAWFVLRPRQNQLRDTPSSHASNELGGIYADVVLCQLKEICKTTCTFSTADMAKSLELSEQQVMRGLRWLKDHQLLEEIPLGWKFTAAHAIHLNAGYKRLTYHRIISNQSGKAELPAEKELPAARPKIRPIQYGRNQSSQSWGLFILNDGEPAYNVTIADAQIGDYRLRFEGGPKSRIGKDDGQNFYEAWLGRPPNDLISGNALRSCMVTVGVTKVQPVIRYDDGDYDWETTIELELNADIPESGIRVDVLSQRLVGKRTTSAG